MTDDRVTIGWVKHTIPGSEPRRRCVTCFRRVRSGVVSMHNPGGPIMCWRCYRLIMVDSVDPMGGGTN